MAGTTKESSSQFLEGARVKKMEPLDWLWDPCIILFGGVKQRDTDHSPPSGGTVLLADQPSGCEIKLTFLRLSLLPKLRIIFFYTHTAYVSCHKVLDGDRHILNEVTFCQYQHISLCEMILFSYSDNL